MIASFPKVGSHDSQLTTDDSPLTLWDGVRNYGARNNLKTMKKGDRVLFYHSNEGLAIVGIAEVLKEAPRTARTLNNLDSLPGE